LLTIISAEFIVHSNTFLDAFAFKVITTFSLTNSEGFSSRVVNNVPTGTFEESKGELRDLGIMDFRSTHEFVEEDLSFEVGVSRAGTTLVFKRSTTKSGATEVFSEHAGKGFNVEEDVSLSLDDSFLVSGTISVKESIEMVRSETEDVSKFVSSGIDVLLMGKRVLIISVDVSKVEIDGR